MISNVFIFAFAFFFGSCLIIFAQKPTAVGIKDAPPFAFRDSKGEWVASRWIYGKKFNLNKMLNFNPKKWHWINCSLP